MKKYAKKASVILLSLMLTAISFGCDDLIEKNLEKEQVSIIAPANNTKLSAASVVFWWDKLDDALEYNVQVVSPSFGQVQRLLADTIVTDNKLTLSLEAGDFEWRVKALNGSSQTEFVSAAFSVESTQDDITDPPPPAE
ncbi:MAG: hypothetical protein LBR81_03540 [Prevotellaceae bacterium]|jgi:hypothetical protein|nr:hypothetical protein [Prevotellaceae bacterium]